MSAGALSGVTIVDLTWSWAGPMSTRMLADLGAELLRIEGVVRPDWTRFLCYAENEPGTDPWDRGGYFQDLNQGKKSVVLNLATDEAQDILWRLIDQADVLVESFAPPIKHRWGLSYERLRERNPRLVMVSLTGFGQTGPFQEYSVFGPTMEAMAGTTSLGGVDGGPPERVGVFYGDPISGCAVAAAIVTALYEAKSTGYGQYIDVAGTEVAMGLISEAFVYAQDTGETPPRPAGDEDALLSGCFETADGEYVCLSCFDDAQIASLARALDIDSPGSDLSSAVAANVRILAAPDVLAGLEAAGLPASLIYDSRDLMTDAHLEVRGAHWPLDHGAVGRRVYMGSPYRSSTVARPLDQTWPAPLYGQHTREVLEQRLGIGQAEWDALLRAGAVSAAPTQELIPPPAPVAVWKTIGLVEP